MAEGLCDSCGAPVEGIDETCSRVCEFELATRRAQAKIARCGDEIARLADEARRVGLREDEKDDC